MTTAKMAHLTDRGVVAVTGADAKTFLDNLVTNDLDILDKQDALFAGLLTPQGKILFEFFVIKAEAGRGYLLETQSDQIDALIKRLSLYKLRAKIEIRDQRSDYAVCAVWDPANSSGEPLVSETSVAPTSKLQFRDPRAAAMGWHMLALPADDAELTGPEDYHAHRVALGIAEAPHDYVLGDTFPHEANWDRYGVNFRKGCYVGQEVVSRMQNKSVIRKRVVKISSSTTLVPGTDIQIGDAVIGTVGTVVGSEALAMLRLDRAAEAAAKGQTLTVAGHPIMVDAAALADYRASVANKPIIDL